MATERDGGRRTRTGAAMLLACAGMSPLQAQGLPWQVWESPARLATLDPGDRVLLRSSHCPGNCRYDRSNAGGEDPAHNPYPLRWLYRDGEEAVVFDERGAGAVTRIWLTTGFGTSGCIDPGVRVRFYVDDAPLPALDIALAALFDGSTPPFTPPLVSDRLASSGGYQSHVPIAHERALRIALVGAGNGGSNPCTGDDRRLLWFQVQHHRIAPGAPIDSFVAGLDAPGWRAFLAHAGEDPWDAMLAPQEATAVLQPAGTLPLASHAGPGWLRGLRLRVPRARLADIALRVHVDGEPSIDLPLADYFAVPPDAVVPARGVLLGEDAGGWLYSWFPMPFATSVQVELAALASLAEPVQVDSSLAFEPGPLPPAAARFGADLVDTCTQGGDIVLYAQRGAGKLVGLSARYRSTASPPTPVILEGDERAMVDDASAPLWQGTGVEDFFGGGFYFDQGAYSQPLAGASLVRDGDGFETAAWRLLPADALAYTRALRLLQEAGLASAQPSAMCVRAVTHAYRQARASVVSLGHFEIGEASAAAHAYALPAEATCAPLQALFGDEPPTSRSALACHHAGTSRFRFRIAAAAAPLQLARVFDAGAGEPGEVAGSAAARILVDGIEVGRFAPAMANPARRWQRDAVFLDLQPAAGLLEFEVVTEPGAAPAFAESAWELLGGWTDAVFADGYEARPVSPGPRMRAH